MPSSAGNGSVGAVAVNGTITAGATATAVGTLTTGPEAWNAGGAYLSKVTSATAASDELVMSGLTITSPFTINVSSGTTAVTVPTTTTFVLADDTEAAATNPFSSANTAATLAKLTLITPGLTSATGAFALSTQADTSRQRRVRPGPVHGRRPGADQPAPARGRRRPADPGPPPSAVARHRLSGGIGTE